MNFKRGEYLLLKSMEIEPLEGALVKFIRKSRRTSSLTVEFVNDAGAYKTGSQINVNNWQVMKSARKAGKMQGSRQRLIMCTSCNYRLRGSDTALDGIGIPKCPGCGRQMEKMEIEPVPTRYDPACMTLALHFMQDFRQALATPEEFHAEAERLANEIQTTVETFFDSDKYR